jgi:hypothetical protein
VAKQSFLPWHSFTRTTSAANYLAGGQASKTCPPASFCFSFTQVSQIFTTPAQMKEDNYVEFQDSTSRPRSAGGRIAA